MTNEDIIRSWLNNKSYGKRGYRLNTDGTNLYSYNMCLGKTVNGVKKLVPLDDVPMSITTTRQYNLAKKMVSGVTHA